MLLRLQLARQVTRTIRLVLAYTLQSSPRISQLSLCCPRFAFFFCCSMLQSIWPTAELVSAHLQASCTHLRCVHRWRRCFVALVGCWGHTRQLTCLPQHTAKCVCIAFVQRPQARAAGGDTAAAPSSQGVPSRTAVLLAAIAVEAQVAVNAIRLSLLQEALVGMRVFATLLEDSEGGWRAFLNVLSAHIHTLVATLSPNALLTAARDGSTAPSDGDLSRSDVLHAAMARFQPDTADLCSTSVNASLHNAAHVALQVLAERTATGMQAASVGDDTRLAAAAARYFFADCTSSTARIPPGALALYMQKLAVAISPADSSASACAQVGSDASSAVAKVAACSSTVAPRAPTAVNKHPVDEDSLLATLHELQRRRDLAADMEGTERDKIADLQRAWHELDGARAEAAEAQAVLNKALAKVIQLEAHCNLLGAEADAQAKATAQMWAATIPVAMAATQLAAAQLSAHVAPLQEARRKLTVGVCACDAPDHEPISADKEEAALHATMAFQPGGGVFAVTRIYSGTAAKAAIARAMQMDVAHFACHAAADGALQIADHSGHSLSILEFICIAMELPQPRARLVVLNGCTTVKLATFVAFVLGIPCVAWLTAVDNDTAVAHSQHLYGHINSAATKHAKQFGGAGLPMRALPDVFFGTCQDMMSAQAAGHSGDHLPLHCLLLPPDGRDTVWAAVHHTATPGLPSACAGCSGVAGGVSVLVLPAGWEDLPLFPGPAAALGTFTRPPLDEHKMWEGGPSIFVGLDPRYFRTASYPAPLLRRRQPVVPGKTYDRAVKDLLASAWVTDAVAAAVDYMHVPWSFVVATHGHG